MDKLKNVQLILCDLDGTLLDDQKRSDPYLKDILEKKQIPLIFVSGRNYHIIQDLIKEYEINLPYITNNGANIFLNDQCIYEKSIVSEELIKALKILEASNIPYLAYSNFKIFCKGNQPELEVFKQRLIDKCEIIYDFDTDFLRQEKIFKVVIINTNAQFMKSIQNEIHTNCLHTHCVQSEGYVYTLSHREVSKGAAVQWLLRYLNVNPEKVVAFGDNYNDVSMFKVVGISVAVDNALEDIKKQATYVTKSNQDHGVSWFVSKYVE